MTLPKDPQILLSAEFGIGYSDTLASTGDAIALGKGTHYLLARNGRGKTTLLRTIAGSLKRKSGTHETRGSVQFLPENFVFDAELTAGTIFKALIPAPLRQTALELAGRTELDLRKPYGKLSTGNRRKVSLIVAECSTRGDAGNILLLDEPFSGLDAHVRAAFERHWADHTDVLRLVSCHPDYDGMAMDSAVIIDHHVISHRAGSGQTWSDLKPLLS